MGTQQSPIPDRMTRGVTELNLASPVLPNFQEAASFHDSSAFHNAPSLHETPSFHLPDLSGQATFVAPALRGLPIIQDPSTHTAVNSVGSEIMGQGNIGQRQTSMAQATLA
jgi:hypothetical protein